METLDVLNIDQIEKNLMPEGKTTAELKRIEAECLALTVKSVDDAEGYEVCSNALKPVKKIRIAIEKRRKELKAGALEYGRKLDSEAARIRAIAENAEAHLAKQLAIIDDHKAELAREAQRKKDEALRARFEALTKVKAQFSVGDVTLMSDSVFEHYLQEKTMEFEKAEAERKAQEAELAKLREKQRQDEESKRKLEQELSELRAKRIAEQEAEKAKAAAKIAEQEAQIEAARKQKLEDEKREAERVAKAKAEQEAAEARARAQMADEKMFDEIKKDFPTLELAWIEIARLRKVLK